MTDELIRRDDCIAAIEAAPNADDAIALIRALPAADAGALGAVAMREACLDVYVKGDWDWFSDAHDAMEAIPVPTHAAQLAAALALPEVAAIVDAAQWARNRLEIIADESWHGDGRDLKRSIIGVFSDFDEALLACGSSIPPALSALEARHD